MCKFIIRTLTICSLLVLSATTAFANNMCPFCSAINLTFAEQMSKNDVVVIAKVTNIPPPIDDIDAELPKASFEIVQVVKGKNFVKPEMRFQALLVGKYEIGEEFMVMGADPPSVVWTTPMKATERFIDYIGQLNGLPEKGPDRLAFFQDYFEDEESMLAFDAYDEFASADYEDLIQLKDRLEHDKLIGWIQDLETSPNRKRLYFTLLGICGQESDIEILEELIRSGDRKKQAGLDALIACYLNLKKADGVDLIQEQFIDNEDCDYVDTLAAVSALRFHGTEVDFIPRERIVGAVRKLLDRPKMADLVIPDLARWEDWSVMEKLVQMFKDADEDTNWLRVPVINYLRVCPDPKAKEHIAELRKIDPNAVRRAEFFAEFDDNDSGWGDDDEETETEDEVDEFDKLKDKAGEEIGESEDTSSEKTENENPLRSGDGDDSVNNLNSANPVKAPTTVFVSAQESDTADKVTVRKVPMTDDFTAEDQLLLTKSDAPETAQSGDVTNIPSEFDEGLVVSIPSEVPASNNNPVQPVANNVLADNSGTSETSQIAQTQANSTTPVAQSTPVYNSTWAIIFIPMLISALVFVLLWSVINGWFERLIF